MLVSFPEQAGTKTSVPVMTEQAASGAISRTDERRASQTDAFCQARDGGGRHPGGYRNTTQRVWLSTRFIATNLRCAHAAVARCPGERLESAGSAVATGKRKEVDRCAESLLEPRL